MMWAFAVALVVAVVLALIGSELVRQRDDWQQRAGRVEAERYEWQRRAIHAEQQRDRFEGMLASCLAK